MLFLTVSFVGADSFRQYLQTYNESFNNIIVSQVLPPPRATSHPILSQYRSALATYYPGSQPNFVSLEGYVVGQFMIEAVSRIRGPLTSENFLNAVYTSSVFYIGGLTIGPYSDISGPAQCNQGLRQVFLTTIQSDGNYTVIPDFEFKWETCLSSTSTLLNANRIKWGQTAALTGSTKDLGIGMNQGILAAFYEANRNDALRGVYMDLVALDDGYAPAPAYTNTIELLNRHRVFGLIGSVGTPTANNITQAMKDINSTAPYIGAFTGARSLRDPFQRNIINMRASYIDETASMVNYLTNRLVSRISIFYQDDTFGLAGYEGLALALNASGLVLQSEGKYTRLTLDIEAGMTNVLAKNPEAVVMIGAYAPLAKAVQFGRSYNAIGANAIYLTVSFVGADSFRAELQARNQSFNNVFVTQVVPPPRDLTDPLVQRYQDALFAYDRSAIPNYVSLEGYLVGLLAIETVARIRGNLTPANFLNAVYESQLFVISKQRLGPYVDTAATASGNCNQGQHRVWFTSIAADGNYTVVPGSDFSWEGTCLSASNDLLRPLVFGQSSALTGPTQSLGLNMRSGIMAAFTRFNRQGGLEGRPVKLLSYDDGYEPTRTAPNTNELISHGVVGLLGFTGTPTSNAAVNISRAAKIPFIAAYTGASSLRSPCSQYVINMRASYIDEAAAMIGWLLDAKYASLRNGRSFSNIAIFYQNDTFGQAGLEGVQKALTYRKKDLAGSGVYTRNTVDVEAGLIALSRLSPVPDAIVMVGAYAPCAKFVRLGKTALPDSTVYFAISFVGADSFVTELKNQSVSMTDSQGRPSVYISQVVPNPSDPEHPLAAEYLEELSLQTPAGSPNYIAFEGYAAGRFATRALQLISGEVTPQALTSTIFEYPIFNMKDYLLGPFSLGRTSTRNSSTAVSASNDTCSCNQGSHQVWLTFVNSTYDILNMDGFEFIFDTCGVVYEVFFLQAPSDAIRGVIMAISILCIIFVLVCAAGVIYYRNTKTMIASSPVFLLLICGGALLLAITPFFTLSYGDGPRGNNICMTWIWFLGLGYTLFFTPIVIKTWRVHRIFNNRVLSRVITIKDRELILYVAVPVVGELAILIAWTIYSPAKLITATVPGTVDQVLQLCTTEGGIDQPLVIAQAVFFAIQALIGCIFAFLTRNIKYGAFKESMEILFAVYNLTFLSVILVPLHSALSYNAIPSTIIRSIGVLFLVFVSMAALFGMKFYRIITKTEKMSTSSRRSIYGSRSGFGTSNTGTTTGSTTGSGRSGSSKSSNTSDDTTSSSEVRARKAKKKSPKQESSESTESSEESPRGNKTSGSAQKDRSSGPKDKSSAQKDKGSGSKESSKPQKKPRTKPSTRNEDSQETEPSSEDEVAASPKKILLAQTPRKEAADAHADVVPDKADESEATEPSEEEPKHSKKEVELPTKKPKTEETEKKEKKKDGKKGKKPKKEKKDKKSRKAPKEPTPKPEEQVAHVERAPSSSQPNAAESSQSTEESDE